jgi:hypothetical protein
MAFDYPSESEIVDPRKGLPPATAKLLEPCYSEGQWRLRELQNSPVYSSDKASIEILTGISLGVLDRLVQVALRKHADSFDAFRAAIGPDGGAAELGMKYAHFIHKDVTRGRMANLWHTAIRGRLFEAISKAENQWWQNHRAQSAADEPAKSHPPRDVAASAARRQAVVDPIRDAKGWSTLDWALEAEVDYNTASDYLNGLTNPHRRTRVRLARALGIPVQQLPF